MLRAAVALPALLVAGGVLAGTARAQPASGAGGLSDVPLPGGIRAALHAIHDPLTPDRGQFLLEVIRRLYNAPIRPKRGPEAAVLEALVAQLDRARRQSPAAPPEILPLPLTPRIWTDVVFAGRVALPDLVRAILQSRQAALFYTGLLSLDADTRAWLAGEPELIKDIVSRYAAAFEVAAPALRVSGARVRVPGGPPAEPAWEALVSHRATAPAEFVRALLDERNGRLAYFFGALAVLTPAQLRFVLGLDSTDPAARIACARGLSGVFDRIAQRWDIGQHAFWRPAMDPALLAADLPAADDGRPLVPGTRLFWQAVFTGADASSSSFSQALAGGGPVAFSWLSEQVFDGTPAEVRSRYREVLFASRILTQVTADSAGDALEAVRTMGAYPALAATLEGAGLRDVTAFANAARRARRLSGIGDRTRAARALSQFQGVLALLARGARRGSLPQSALPSLVSSLAVVDVNAQGDYEGRMVRWVEQHLGSEPDAATSARPYGGATADDGDPFDRAPAPIARALFHLLSGPPPIEPRFVEWEGTRYRLDFRESEATRIGRLLGQAPCGCVPWAVAFTKLADALQRRGLTPGQLRGLVGPPGRNSSIESLEDPPSQARDVMLALERAARDRDIGGAGRLAPALRLVADDLLANALRELVYATALGQPDRTPVAAGDVAQRHDFGLGLRHTGPWQLPVPASDPERGWHVVGSLLGLEVALADRSLVRVSLEPLPRRPTLNGPDRRAFIDAVALVEPSSLTDKGRDAIVTAMQNGRLRVAALRTPDDVAAAGEEIRLGPARRNVLVWMLAHEPDRVPAFLSPSELFRLGRGDAATLHAWGAPAGARTGCLCLQMPDRRPLDSLAGRWDAASVASAFPDLNLRLAELLAELRMPPQLLAAVLAPATLDFVEKATSRDPDDRRGLVEFVQALRPEQVEEYLALLTAGGPLVPEVGGRQP